MSEHKLIEGFSKLSREKKLSVLAQIINADKTFISTLNEHLHTDDKIQKLYNNFSENTISNYYLPYSVAPNFLINSKIYHIPMVTEESSVVAAASSAAKFWSVHGGFKASVRSMIKVGQVHFTWSGDELKLKNLFEKNRKRLYKALQPLTQKMQNRGGGIVTLELRNMKEVLPDYFQLLVTFNTVDSMGANFINSCLELLASEWRELVNQSINNDSDNLEIIMAILSNYTPDCNVRVELSGHINIFDGVYSGMSGKEFGLKFVQAVNIAQKDIYRAVTHNKGIFNGIDAVILATGNDFRATEACGHAYASTGNQYHALSHAIIENEIFKLVLEVPFAVGTIGGLTRLHPLAEKTFQILNYPNAEELMMIAASVGLANNFSAVRALITSGIQLGHMRMHLSNILSTFNLTVEEEAMCKSYFADKTVTTAAVENYIRQIRN